MSAYKQAPNILPFLKLTTVSIGIAKNYSLPPLCHHLLQRCAGRAGVTKLAFRDGQMIYHVQQMTRNVKRH